MKLAVVGSRTFTDYRLLKRKLNWLREYVQIESIISGGAKGADSLAESYSIRYGISFIKILPDWKKYSKSAGPARNTEIIKRCDFVLAFWDGKSKGTLDSINKAKKLNKEVIVVNFNE